MKKWKLYYIFLSLVFIFLIIYVYINNILEIKYQTEVHFLELPTGDCTLLETKEKNILIGGADKKDSKHINKYLEKQKINNIAELIIVSPNKNNIRGFLSLLEKIKIERIYLPHITDLDDDTKKFLKSAKDKDIKIYQVQGKEKWEINDLTLLFIRPLEHSTIPRSARKTIIKLNFPKTSILWLPAIEEMDKIDLFLNPKELKADILKVSGNKKSIVLSKDFLDAVNPKTIIFGDSEKEKEEELRLIYGWNPNVDFFSIYEEGDIIFYGKGKNYNITTKRRMNIKIQ